jgi:hypothetical protein
MLTVTVVKSGPFFDGRALRKLDEMCDEIERRVATIGASMIRSELDRVLKRQTPYYRLQNEAQPDPPGWKITDNGVIYGPWLEGVGSRNYPVTRFRGYATYRRTFAEIDRRAQIIADYTAREFMPGMN